MTSKMAQPKGRTNFGSDEYEQSRCEFYGTTLYSCRCRGYIFRKTCRHVDFKRKKLIDKDDHTDKYYKEALASISGGIEAVPFVEKYSEDLLKKAKIVGDVFEKHGRLYLLK